MKGSYFFTQKLQLNNVYCPRGEWNNKVPLFATKIDHVECTCSR